MGLELDLSELAALGPILTAVGGARATARPDVDDGAAAGTGCCVTPTTAASVDGESMAPRQDGGLVDDDAGCVTPKARQDGGGEDAAAVGIGSEGFVTPTSAASALGPATVCPPAPRKPAKRKSCGRTPLRVLFPVPHDLDAVFLPLAAASPPLTPPSKKTRVHVVG